MIRSRRIDRNAGFPLQRIAQAAMVSRRHQNFYRSPRLKAEVSGSTHKSVSNGPITTKAGPPAPISNRNTKLLEFPLNHRKQSAAEFLIDTFRAFFPPDAIRIARQRIARLRIARERPANTGQLSAVTEAHQSGSRPSRAQKLENRATHVYSATSKFLIDNFYRLCDSLIPLIPHREPPEGGRLATHSRTPELINRPSGPRKLENQATYVYSATSKFLIDNFHRHFQSFVARIFRKRPPQPELHRASKVTSILISKRQEDS
jgi:hypothetical protein